MSIKSTRFTRVSAAASAAVTVVLAVLPMGASASVVTIESLLAPSTYTANGASLSSSFAAAGPLNGNTAVSGSIRALFRDNTDPLQFTRSQSDQYLSSTTYITGYSSYNCGSFSSGYRECRNYFYDTDNFYARRIVEAYFNPSESAKLSVGSMYAFGGSINSDSSALLGTSSFSNYYGDGYNRYNVETYRRDYGYSGDFEVELILDAASIAQINSSGSLAFGIASVFGDFLIQSVQLNLTVEPNSPAGVPEPGTLALVGLALGGLALRAGQRQRVA